jgi:hypothetical protein
MIINFKQLWRQGCMCVNDDLLFKCGIYSLSPRLWKRQKIGHWLLSVTYAHYTATLVVVWPWGASTNVGTSTTIEDAKRGFQKCIWFADMYYYKNNITYYIIIIFSIIMLHARHNQKCQRRQLTRMCLPGCDENTLKEL